MYVTHVIGVVLRQQVSNGRTVKRFYQLLKLQDDVTL